jgi:hypothetical protein
MTTEEKYAITQLLKIMAQHNAFLEDSLVRICALRAMLVDQGNLDISDDRTYREQCVQFGDAGLLRTLQEEIESLIQFYSYENPQNVH